MDECEVNEDGTPQGGIISPLLANVYLDIMDEWISRQWEDKRTRYPYAQQQKKLFSLRKTSLIPGFLVRYADNFVIITDTRAHAENWKARLQVFLQDKMKLTLSQEKTLITDIRKKYIKFLGYQFKIVPGKAKKGYISRTIPDKDRLKQKVDTIVKDIKKIPRNYSREQMIRAINRINSQIRGIIQYYQCCTWVNVAMKKHSRRLQLAAKSRLKQYRGKWIPANQTRNLPRIHQQYKQKLPSIKYRDIYIGFTSLIFCNWEKTKSKNPEETPYTEAGRELYFRRTKRKRIHHSVSRGGQFGGESVGSSGGTAGGSSRSSTASTIERNRRVITKNGTASNTSSASTSSSQVKTGSAGTHPGAAENTHGGTTAPRPGMAGTTPSSTATPRPGMAGTTIGSTTMPRSGVAGTAPGGGTAPRPGTAEIGTNSQTTHLTGGSKAGPETPATPRPGIAGTGINGQAARRSGGTGPASGSPAAPRPGTAGTSTGSPASPNPGTAGTGASTVSAKGATAQPGAAVSHSTSTRSTKITGKERASRTPISSGGAATPPATTTVQHTQSTKSRSTRRSVTESKQTVTRNSAERAAHPSGTAGTAAPGALRQPTATPQAGRVVPPVTGPQPPKQARSSPVQQETRQTSVPVKAPVGGASPVVRPGTAGTVPETRRGQTERATVRKAAEGKKAGSKQPKAPGIKRQSTPPAAGKKPGPKTPDRSRGSGHG